MRYGVHNGSRGTITAFDVHNAALNVHLDTGKQVRLPGRYLAAGHVTHGYTVTAHKAQGATAARCFVLGSDQYYQELGYVALTRGRHANHFYIAAADIYDDELDLPPKDPQDPLEAVTRALGVSDANTWPQGGTPSMMEAAAGVTRAAVSSSIQRIPWARA